jgi:hypothetical protein
VSLCFAGLCQLRALAAFIATHLDAELVEKGNATAVHFRFLPKCLADLASIARDDPTMRTVAVIFAMALKKSVEACREL